MGEGGGGLPRSHSLSSRSVASTRQRTAAREARGEGVSHMKGAGMLVHLALGFKLFRPFWSHWL